MSGTDIGDRMTGFLSQMLESQIAEWESYVSSREPFCDDGERWEGIGTGAADIDEAPFRTCEELFEIQRISRILARENPFAINIHGNRQNYIVGWGHTCVIVGRDDTTPKESIERVQAVLDQVLKENRWANRQREMMLRADRDGEVFIRKFGSSDGIMRFRFIEPRQIQPPAGANVIQTFGIETLPEDTETAVKYFVDGRPIDAGEIQHRKYNVDSSIKRGYPLLHPARKHLVRAVKMLQNMSVATEIQTAIALIRKHAQANQQAVRAFVKSIAERDARGPGPGTDNVLRYGAGSILDVPQGQEYTIPPQMDPQKTVSALQAELRSIAAMVRLPEFMVSSDASNSNFASTMVAEGPAVKDFEAAQQQQVEYDTELLEAALEHAANIGLISRTDLDAVLLHVEPPHVATRNRLEEAQVRQIDMGLGILSPQTASTQIGVEYDQEQTNLELHGEQSGLLPAGLGVGAWYPGGDDDDQTGGGST